jgi:glycosyltransferase involved in cell wall biosynthesis
MKKVLIIDERFPSTGGSRTEKFVKFLPKFGWEPLILTIDQKGRNDYAEEILRAYTKPDIKLYSTKTFPDFSALKKIPIDRLWGIFNRAFFIPDTTIGWIPFALNKGLQIIEREKPQLIYSTSPQEGVHLIAYLLKKFSKLLWVADFRDLWTLYKKRYKPLTYFHHKINIHFEKSVYKKWSDSLISNTEENKKLMIKHFQVCPEKIAVIPNGFDYDDVPENKIYIRGKEKLVLGYLGAVEKPAICFDEFVFGFEKALKSDNNIFLKIWSNISDKLKANLMNSGEVYKHLIFESYRSHQGSMREFKNVDVPLVLLKNEYPHVVPQKLYNYLAHGKPILAVVPPMGCAAKIVHETESGSVVSPRDSNKIAECLIMLRKQQKKGLLRMRYNELAVKKYRRDNLTRQLVYAFNDLLYRNTL